jgi:hypothetical protein
MSLGTLFIDLKANVADFVSGMGAAAYASKQAGKDIHESFENLGGLLGEVLGPLGEVGAIISATFSKVGDFAGGAASGIGKLGGAIGLVGAGAGVAVGSLAAIEVGVIAIALHATEAAAKIGLMSQITGVSTEALSGLGYAAKQSGVDQEQLTKGLEKLNKAIFAAAVAPESAQNAFTRLGVSVKGADGAIRSTEAIFGDLATKFSGMPDTAERGALAMQLFGKAGAELIPLLKKGKEGIDAFVETAKKLGLVIDQETAEAAHHFEQTLNELKAAGEGASLQLSKQLLPAMQAVATALTEGLTEKGSGIDDLISGVKTITQYFISFGGLVAFIFKEAGAVVANFVAEMGEKFSTLVAQAKAAAHLDYTGIVNAAKEGTARLEAVDQVFFAQSKKNWLAYQTLLTNAFKDSADSEVKKPVAGTKVDLNKETVDKRLEAIKAQIAALDQQAAAEVRLAGATQLSQAAQRIQVADNAAAATIQKLNAEADKTTGAEKARLKKYIEDETDAIKANSREKVVGADIVKINTELQKETDGYSAQIAGLQAITAAYELGSAAIAAAGIDKQLEKDREKVQEAEAEYKLAFNTIGTTVDRLAELAIGVRQANDDLDVHAAQLAKIRQLTIDETIAKETRAFQEELPAIEAVTAAHLKSAEAVRQAQIGQKVAAFESANPAADPSQIAKIRALYTEQSDIQKEAQVASEAGAYSLVTQYTNELAKLTDIRKALIDNRDSTLVVDAAIYDANDKIIKQWDTAALKVGTLTDKTRALLNELAIDGKNLGENVFKTFSSAITGLEDQLGKLVSTGKANFKSLLDSFNTSLATAGIKNIFSNVAGGIEKKIFGGAVPGLGGGKADGSSSSPFYVMPVDASGNVLGSILGKGGAGGGAGNSLSALAGGTDGSGEGDGSGGGAGGGLSSIFSGLTSKLGSIFSSLAGTLSSIIGGIGHSIGSIFSGIFGGGMEAGGSVSPGKLYMVGEKHPEFFSPKVPGQIASQLKIDSGGRSIETHVHFHGVRDFDSFKASQVQVLAGVHEATASAYARSR